MVHAMDVNPVSPNEIPPRFSSAGIHSPRRVRSVPRPLAEESWLASGTRPANAAVPNGPSSPPPAYQTALPSPRTSPPRANRRDKRKSTQMAHPDPSNIGADLIYQRKAPWSSDKESILLGPFEYMDGHPGKDIRAQMISAFNTWLCVPPASLEIITKAVGMLHTASLLIDDVEDSSSLRRGVPVAHAIFGEAQTINSANYVYFLALRELGKLDNPCAISVYAEEMVNLHRGQGMDLWWRDSLTCPSEDDYLEMVSNKTGGLFRLAVKLMQTESPNGAFALSPHTSGTSTPSSAPSNSAPHPTTTNPIIPLVNTVGLVFQILDDYQNLASTVYTANKGLAEDLTEGKFSFPVSHAIRMDPSNRILPNILQQRTKDEDVKRYAVRYIEGTGSFAYTRRVLRVLDARATSLIADVDAWDAEENPSMQQGHGLAAGRRKGDGVRSILERLRVSEPVHHTNGNGHSDDTGPSGSAT